MDTLEYTPVQTESEFEIKKPEPVKPEVGMGAYVKYYTDCQSVTISSVSPSGKRVGVKADKAVLLNGMNSNEPDALKCYPGGFCAHVEGVQRYEFTPQPENPEQFFSLRKNGRWVRVGETTNGGCKLYIGERYHYYDYNF